MLLLYISHAREKIQCQCNSFVRIKLIREKYVSLLQAHDRGLFAWTREKGVLGL